MGSHCWIEGVYGMEYNFRTVKTFKIFIEKRIVNDWWIVCGFGMISKFGMKYGYKIVNAFKILIGKEIVNDYWTVCAFGIASVYVM